MGTCNTLREETDELQKNDQKTAIVVETVVYVV